MSDVEIILSTIDDVRTVARRIDGIPVETPLLDSPCFNWLLVGRLQVKAENLQVTGSFKLRGVANRAAALTDDEMRCGVIVRSSDNHRLAIADCAQLMGTTAVVIALDAAPATQIGRIKTYGVRVVQVPMKRLSQIDGDLAAREYWVFVPPADNFWVAADAGAADLRCDHRSLHGGGSVRDHPVTPGRHPGGHGRRGARLHTGGVRRIRPCRGTGQCRRFGGGSTITTQGRKQRWVTP